MKRIVLLFVSIGFALGCAEEASAMTVEGGMAVENAAAAKVDSKTGVLTTAQRAKVYIEKYSDIAVEEMYRSGIPASITLAQGMLESGYGLGTLAVKANNHFGIKCHSDWKGRTIHHDDDLKGECFRKYSSAEESFRDHSDFLRFKERYQSLFELDIKDYKSWAYGLKKAGYATNPAYATRLIEIIERYDLTQFDSASVKNKSKDKHKKGGKNQEVAQAEEAQTPPPAPVILSRPQKFVGTGNKGTYAVSLQREVMEVNGVPFIYARAGETFESISAQYNLFPKELMKYNEAGFDSRIKAGQVIYLQPKKTHAAKGLDKHICSNGETLFDIAQKYAIKLKSLMKINSISDPYLELREDDTILLQKPSRK